MVHKIVANADGVEIWRTSQESSRAIRTEADVKTRLALEDRENKIRIAELMKQELQAIIDHWVARSRLPQDDPAIQSDPSRPDFFWDGDDLVAREIIVESITWDGSRYVPVLRRARE